MASFVRSLSRQTGYSRKQCTTAQAVCKNNNKLAQFWLKYYNLDLTPLNCTKTEWSLKAAEAAVKRGEVC